ncbi:MAG: anhydro-N-acetylmuramic acid kinase [Opitutae bacterium]|nr:anhydro-N-acetylmuramic acid kinase [Opitutae bacterium]
MTGNGPIILRCCGRFNRSFHSDVTSGPKDELFVGVLSGTSVDAVDAALVRFGARAELVATHTLPYPPELRGELLRLAVPGEDEIDRLGGADVAVGRHFARAVNELLEFARVERAGVHAIGSHGQTVRHRPGRAVPFTLQVGDPNTIAAQTGLPVVADFRRKDMALGGQGAPLVPAFHAAIFGRAGEARAVVNIGGIANVTLLPADPTAPVRGFDTGPGNTLLDAWCRQQLGEPMDRDGAFAARGRVQEELLRALLADGYFARPAPKSTGPEHFSPAWLAAHVGGYGPADVQATLVALTAQSIAESVKATLGASGVGVFICGGGARNPVLMRALQERLPGCQMQTTAALGVDPGWVEAMAFAWLARQRMHHGAGNCPAVTGAMRGAVLGGVWLPE